MSFSPLVGRSVGWLVGNAFTDSKSSRHYRTREKEGREGRRDGQEGGAERKEGEGGRRDGEREK